ncbi:tRNA pseudouridine(38-40) synthase TruA [Marisediminicola senii]|uniref:tRNA pseudouridine(38-40) synthase TruA n=1 Tax=Marisediminicola senii TaxID=2711233 RepID=UPI0013ED3A2D|nr:tRNA pseudouridine(38-40) synthase TruA [Marisediminicola senii]
MRIRLDIAYDGTDFTGWTRQPGLRTVQGELDAALATIFRRQQPSPELTVAGRTDAGVHALGQVAHLDVTATQVRSLHRVRKIPSGGHHLRPPESLARRLNGIAGLSSDVVVTAASVAPEGFDARFSGIWRRYEYRVADAAGPRNPLERGNTVWYPARLDLDRMNAAAQTLLGLHDWASFCKPRDFATTIRTLLDFRWNRLPSGVFVASVQADAFCHSMVRALVGATIAVGQGKLAPHRLVGIRDLRERTSDFKVMPAKGLTLMEVGYPPDAELGARAEQTRAHRPPITLDGDAGGVAYLDDDTD